MPYCVVTAAAAAVAGGAHAQEEEEVRIFYQPYGHGATKVLLIIGTARLAHSPPLPLFCFVSSIVLVLVSFLVPNSTFLRISPQSNGTQVSRGRTSRGARR